MNQSAVVRNPLRFRYVTALFMTFAVVGILYLAVAVPRASALVAFCDHVTLQPYGHSGDRCWGPGNYLLNASVSTEERAGCVDFANSENVLLQSWVCGAKESHPAAYVYAVNDGKKRKGVIRNNNLSFTGVFIGNEVCYEGC